MSLGPLTCDKRRERDPQGGRSREGIRGKYLHPSPPSKMGRRGGGQKQSVGLASKPRAGKALHRHRKYRTWYSNFATPRNALLLVARFRCRFACEPNIKGFAIFDLACREPFVSLGAFALPSDAILSLFRASSFVDDLLDEEFLFSIANDWGRGVHCPLREKFVVILVEWEDFRRVEDGESMW